MILIVAVERVIVPNVKIIIKTVIWKIIFPGRFAPMETCVTVGQKEQSQNVFHCTESHLLQFPNIFF